MDCLATEICFNVSLGRLSVAQLKEAALPLKSVSMRMKI